MYTFPKSVCINLKLYIVFSESVNCYNVKFQGWTGEQGWLGDTVFWFTDLLGPTRTMKWYAVRQGALIQFYCALSTLCSSPGTCTSTTLSLWNQNHSLTYLSWNDCKSILSDLSPNGRCSHAILSGGKSIFQLNFITYIDPPVQLDSAGCLLEARK